MGKSLIIKGADFSRNAIDSVWNEVQPNQGYIITNPQNTNYGRAELDTTLAATNHSILVKILIPAGKSIALVTENNGAMITDLNLGYVASQENVAIQQHVVVTNIVTYHNPADSAQRQSDGSFLVNNSTGNDLYFYMNICYNISDGPNFLLSGKRVIYKIVV